MTNIIIFFICVLAGFLCGKYFEKQITAKVEFYRSIRVYMSSLKENVSGKQLELDRFDGNFCENASGAFKDYLTKRKLIGKFTKTERKNIEDFFDNIVCSSSQEMTEHIDYYQKLIDEDGRKVVEEEAKRASIYSKLGMLLGAMIGILLM